MQTSIIYIQKKADITFDSILMNFDDQKWLFEQLEPKINQF